MPRQVPTSCNLGKSLSLTRLFHGFAVGFAKCEFLFTSLCSSSVAIAMSVWGERDEEETKDSGSQLPQSSFVTPTMTSRRGSGAVSVKISP